VKFLRRFLAALLTGYGWYEREISGARHPVHVPKRDDDHDPGRCNICRTNNGEADQ
jgi:hypothetical protein